MKTKPKFDTTFEYDEWEEEKRRLEILNDYFGDEDGGSKS